MFEPFPLGLGGGRRSDRHGVTERHPTLALPRPFLDPRDIAAHGAVEEHRPQIPALGHPRGLSVALDYIPVHLCTSKVARRMASRRGLEPLTPGLGNLCSIQLSYRDPIDR